jgi:HSP20 family protein
MNDIEIHVTDDQLTVKGERKVHVPDEARALRRERPVGAFERTIELPTPIDSERVEAKLTSGILSVILPKAAACKPRRIEVRTDPVAS